MQTASPETIAARANQVRSLAESFLAPVYEIKHQPYGHAGITFEVVCSAGRFIVKTSDAPAAFEHSQLHIEEIAKFGIPVPEVVNQGRQDGFSYLILRKIEGRDLGHELSSMSPAQMTLLAEKVVQVERAVGSLPLGQGFGWTSMRVPGPFATWTAVIERDSAGASEQVRELVAKEKPYFDSVEPRCFLDDLTVKNVIVRGGEFQGIVDLDEVCYGDPLYWLSLAEATVMLDVGNIGKFYGDELRRRWVLDGPSHRVCDLYGAIHAEAFLARGVGGHALRDWADARLTRAK